MQDFQKIVLDHKNVLSAYQSWFFRNTDLHKLKLNTLLKICNTFLFIFYGSWLTFNADMTMLLLNDKKTHDFQFSNIF